MGRGTVNGQSVTTNSQGIVTSGPPGTVGMSTVSLVGYTPSSSGSSTPSSGTSSGSRPAVSTPSYNGSSSGRTTNYSGSGSTGYGGSVSTPSVSTPSSGGSSRGAFQTVVNGAVWSTEAGGYVQNGRVVSTTPVYSGGSGASAPVVTTPSGGGSSVPSGGQYNEIQNVYQASAGMTDAQRTQAAINFYAQNNMQSNLQSALTYAQSKGYSVTTPPTGGTGSYDATTPGTTAQTGPEGYDSGNFNIDYSGYVNNQGSDLQKFNAAAAQAGYTPEQTYTMAQTYHDKGGGMSGQPTDQAGMEQLFYQTPEGQNVLQIKQQEEAKMQMQAQQFDDIFAQFDALRQEASQYGVEGQAALAASYNTMLSSIQATEDSIVAQIKGQMSADDPQMLAAIGIIKSEAKKLAEGLLEEINARGVVQSGLYAKAMEDMNEDTMTQIQKMITARVGDLQTQLNNTLLSMAQSRMNIMNTYQTNYSNFLQSQQQNMTSIGIAGLNAQTEAAKIQAENERASAQNANALQIANISATSSKYNTDQTVGASKYQTDIGYKADTAKNQAAWDVAKLNADTDLTVAGINASARGSNGGNGGGLTAYQQAQLENARKEALKREQVMLAPAIANLKAQYQDPKNTTFTNRQELLNQFNSTVMQSAYDPETLEWARQQLSTVNPLSTSAIQARQTKNALKVVTPTSSAKTTVFSPSATVTKAVNTPTKSQQQKANEQAKKSGNWWLVDQ